MVKTEIYTRKFCYYCDAARELLTSKGVTFTEHDVTGKPELRREMIARANGRTTMPQIFIGKVHVGGSDDLHALDAEGRLDPLLHTGEEQTA
jgi:glutaredoxin 3